MRFVVIEGLDGSGKSTQLKLLKEHFENEGVLYKYLHFPRLEEGVYGALIARFLRGEMGPNDKVDPYLVALIFAGDRSEAASMIRSWMEQGYFVIVDRYVYSNIAFQCAKLSGDEERKHLREWILDFEFRHYDLPRPDLNLLLHVPIEFTRQQLANTRAGEDRSYLKGERDIHEKDLGFQESVMKEYLALQQYVDDLKLIDCTDGMGKMQSPASISELIRAQLGREK